MLCSGITVPREVTRLYTLREIQRVTGIHWPTLIKYSRDPRVQKHRVETQPFTLWRHRAIDWFMHFRDVGRRWNRKEDTTPRLEHTEAGVLQRLEADGEFEFNYGSEAEAAAGSVEAGAWAPLGGAPAVGDDGTD